MIRISRFLPFLICAFLLAGAPQPPGIRLAESLDSMDVEHHWLAGAHVNWHTGAPDPGRPAKTHCSAFVAAACERLGIYILRPPEHSQVHLATAQAEWLEREGPAHGWNQVESPDRAQYLANLGQVVVAVFPSPDPSKPGHIAIVRPSEKSRSLLDAEGPQIIQAGAENSQSTSLKNGFRHHRGAWISSHAFQVHFFDHALPDEPTHP